MSEKNIDFLLEEFKDDDSYSQEIMKKLKKYEDSNSKVLLTAFLGLFVVPVIIAISIKYCSFFITKWKILFLPKSISNLDDIHLLMEAPLLLVFITCAYVILVFVFIWLLYKIFLKFVLKYESITISRPEIKYLNDYLYAKRKFNKYNIVKYMSDNIYYLKEGEMNLLNKNNPAVMLDDGCVVYETYYVYDLAKVRLIKKINLYGDRKKDY